jgi:hypothetical protein
MMRLLGEDAASNAFRSVSNAARAAAGAFVDFAKQSLRASLEAEAVDRRLTGAAKELAAAFQAQASAIQETLGVNEDAVKGIQTLLLRFGEAPSAVEGTTRAILDFAAATGRDASDAAAELSRGIASGREFFKGYGIEVDSSKTKSEQLAEATAQLAKKFGGSAAAEGESLAGQLRKVDLQFGEVQEAFGDMIKEFLSRSGAISSVTGLLKDLTDGMRLMPGVISSAFERGKKAFESANAAVGGVGGGMVGLSASLGAGFLAAADLNGLTDDINNADREEMKRREATRRLALPSEPGAGGNNKTKRSALADTAAAKEAEREREAALRDAMRYQMEEARENERNAERLQDIAAFESKASTTREAERQKANERELALQERHEQAMQQQMSRHLAEMKRKEAEAAAVGVAIGAALVNALSQQIDKIGTGQEVDVGATIVDIISGILTVVGGVVGTVAGGPAGTAAGSALGGLAGAGLRAAYRAGKRKHDGGWVGAPRFHNGMWVGMDEQPAILQEGERVLSQAEIRRMGGGNAVDAMAGGAKSGGPTVLLNISTFDARNTREFFEAEGGRGLFNAVRTGRSDVQRLLGGGR